MAKQEAKPFDITERTFLFAVDIVRLCLTLDDIPGIRRTLSHQLGRSGTSIGANVEEAQAAQSRADFVSKCTIALKEARETRYWLRLVTATKLIPEVLTAAAVLECTELTRILGAIVSRSGRRFP